MPASFHKLSLYKKLTFGMHAASVLLLAACASTDTVFLPDGKTPAEEAKVYWPQKLKRTNNQSTLEIGPGDGTVEAAKEFGIAAANKLGDKLPEALERGAKAFKPEPGTNGR